MAAGDLLKLVVNQTMNSEKVQNVLYYEVKSDDTVEGNELALAGGFISAIIAPLWVPIVTLELSFDCVSVQKVFPDPVGPCMAIRKYLCEFTACPSAMPFGPFRLF